MLGEMLELGAAAEELHRRVGRYAAEQGVDLLVGVRGSARAMVEGAAPPDSCGALRFFEDPAEAGEFLRQEARRGRRGAVQRFARSARRAGAGKVSGVTPMLYFLLVRTTAAIRQPVPRLPLHHVSHGVCQPDGAVPVRRARARG